MDDDVQACLDTPLSHINGGGISFVVPDPDSNSSSTTVLKLLCLMKQNWAWSWFFGEIFTARDGKLFFLIKITHISFFRWCSAESTASATIQICTTSWYTLLYIIHSFIDLFDFLFAAVIEDMGKDIRPTYAGSKSSAERLKRGIVHARILVRECLLETERSARQ